MLNTKQLKKNSTARKSLNQTAIEIKNFHEFSPPRQGAAQKLTNALMKGGKRATAERVVRRACALFKSRKPLKESSLIHQAIRNVKPLIELRGPPGRVKPKPVPILPARAEKLAIE